MLMVSAAPDIANANNVSGYQLDAPKTAIETPKIATDINNTGPCLVMRREVNRTAAVTAPTDGAARIKP